MCSWVETKTLPPQAEVFPRKVLGKIWGNDGQNDGKNMEKYRTFWRSAGKIWEDTRENEVKYGNILENYGKNARKYGESLIEIFKWRMITGKKHLSKWWGCSRLLMMSEI